MASISSAVFHLRHEQAGTAYHFQNINLRTSAVLRARLARLQRDLGADGGCRAQEILAAAASHHVGAGNDAAAGVAAAKTSTAASELDSWSGIEYFYLALASLQLSGCITATFVKLVGLAHAKDPASRLVSELARLATIIPQGTTVASICRDVLRRDRRKTPASSSSSVTSPHSSTRLAPPAVVKTREQEEWAESDKERAALALAELKLRRRVHDSLRFGVFLDVAQMRAVSETLSRAAVRVAGDLGAGGKRGVLLVLGPSLPEMAAAHVASCRADVISEVHLVDTSQRRLQTILQGMLSGKTIDRRIFISDGGSPSYCGEEPSWAGDRSYDVASSMFSLHHLTRDERRTVFAFAQAQCKSFIAVVFDQDGVEEGVSQAAVQSPQASVGRKTARPAGAPPVGVAAEGGASRGAPASLTPFFDPAAFACLVDSFERGMRQAADLFGVAASETAAATEAAAAAAEGGGNPAVRLAVTLLAQLFVGMAVDTRGERQVMLQPLSSGELCADMRDAGLIVHGSHKLFEHWWCPVHVIEASSSLADSARHDRGGEALRAENRELRARVQELERLVVAGRT